MLTGTLSRKTVLISLALAAAIALSVVLTGISAGSALAYPGGWAVNTVAGPYQEGNCTSVSVESWKDHVWVAGRGGRSVNAIWVQHSSDKGATWDAPVYLEDGTFQTDEPVVIAGGNNGGSSLFVFVIFGSKREGGGRYQTWIKRSNDLGATFPPANDWHTTTASDKLNHRADHFPGSNRIAWVHNENQGALYTTEVKYGGYINTAGAIHHADKWVSPIDDIGSYEPDIACQFLDEMYVVWNNDVGGGYTKAQIRFQYSDDYGDSWGNHGAASDIVGYDPNYRHSNPRIKSLNDQPVVLCSLQYVATSSWYVGRYHFNAGWLPNNPNDAKIATTNTVRPYPCVNGQKGLYERYFYRNSDGKLEHRTSTGGVTSDFLGDTQIYGGSSTANYSIDCKTHHDGAGTVVGAAVADDGKIYFRHTDGTAPTGSITKPAGADVYYNSDFEVTASATDDFCYTGADVATAVQYYNGIEKVTYYYQEEGGAWHDLPCDGGNVATVPPYKRTALADSLDGKRFKIRGLATDSAGNEGAFISSNWITVDMDPPETTIAVSGKAGDNGYYRSQVSVTLAVSDPTTEKTEYRLTNTAAGAAGAGNWTTYSKPFVFADGKWKVEFYSEDRAGNREVAKTKSLKVDTVAPVCAVTSPSKDTIQTGYTTDEKAEISGFATDSEGMARMKILMDGELITETERNFAGLAYFWPLAGQENKTHEIKVEGTDVAGNRGTSVKRVWVGNVASTWFFPEGNTLPEFRQFICLYNPGDTPVQVRLTFMCEDGQVFTTERAMNPQQRDTVFVKDVVPEGHVGVATQVDSLDPEKAIAAECPMYFIYKNKWKGGHNVFGMNTLQKEFYFAEGTTRNNETDGEFEEWICIMNPGDTPASVVVTYMLGTGLNLDKAYRVEPHSRATVEVAADVGLDQDVSAKVTSDSPIAATRPMYFNYHGWAVDGSAVVGASGPQLAWELAEGCTRRGYQQWLTIQNPNDVDATCDITYMTSGGQVVEAREVVPGRTRATIEVATQVGDDVDVSTTVEADVPIVVERPMYFIYGIDEGKSWDGGESALGNPAPSTMYLLAEGTTIDGFDTFYTLSNSWEKYCNVKVDYILGSGKVVEKEYSIAPHSRLTIKVNDVVTEKTDVSASIYAPWPIALERPMYFNYQGITGGHNVVGFGRD